MPAGLFALLLWVLASLPGDDLQRIQAAPENPLLAFILSDPFVHFLTFGLLALLIGLGLYGRARDTVPFATATVLASGLRITTSTGRRQSDSSSTMRSIR